MILYIYAKIHYKVSGPGNPVKVDYMKKRAGIPEQ
jgi:hypothetical protein